MNISLDTPHADYFIKSYRPGCLRLNTGECDQSVILYESKCLDFPPHSINELKAEHLLPLVSLQPNIVILGTGPRHIFPSHKILAPLIEARIAVEIMHTEAACRTYNIYIVLQLKL